MSGFYAYDQHEEKLTGATYFHGGSPLPNNSNVIAIVSICVTINFIDDWINALDKNI